MGPLDDPMADDFFIPNPPLNTICNCPVTNYPIFWTSP